MPTVIVEDFAGGAPRMIDVGWADLDPADVAVMAEQGDVEAQTWIEAQSRTASWDESLHPRGEGGRFGEKGDTVERDPAAAENALEEQVTSVAWGSPAGAGGWGGTEIPVEDFRFQQEAAVETLNEAGYDGAAVAQAVEGWSWGGDVDLWRDVATGAATVDEPGIVQGVELAREGEIDDVLYRAIGVSPEEAAALSEGMVLDGRGLASWSRDEEVAYVFAQEAVQGYDDPMVAVTMKTDGTVNGLDITALGTYQYAWQEEVIVAAGGYRITGIDREPWGYEAGTTIELTVVPVATPAVVAAVSDDELADVLFGETFGQTAARLGHNARTATWDEALHPRGEGGRFGIGVRGDDGGDAETTPASVRMDALFEATNTLNAAEPRVLVRIPTPETESLLGRLDDVTPRGNEGDYSVSVRVVPVEDGEPVSFTVPIGMERFSADGAILPVDVTEAVEAYADRRWGASEEGPVPPNSAQVDVADEESRHPEGEIVQAIAQADMSALGFYPSDQFIVTESTIPGGPDTPYLNVGLQNMYRPGDDAVSVLVPLTSEHFVGDGTDGEAPLIDRDNLAESINEAARAAVTDPAYVEQVSGEGHRDPIEFGAPLVTYAGAAWDDGSQAVVPDGLWAPRMVDGQVIERSEADSAAAVERGRATAQAVEERLATSETDEFDTSVTVVGSQPWRVGTFSVDRDVPNDDRYSGPNSYDILRNVNADADPDEVAEAVLAIAAEMDRRTEAVDVALNSVRFPDGMVGTIEYGNAGGMTQGYGTTNEDLPVVGVSLRLDTDDNVFVGEVYPGPWRGDGSFNEDEYRWRLLDEATRLDGLRTASRYADDPDVDESGYTPGQHDDALNIATATIESALPEGWAADGSVYGSGGAWSITDPEGNAGTIEVDIPRDGTLHVGLMQFESGMQGTGVGTAMAAALISSAEQMGMTSVEFFANIDVGGFAWARMGAYPTDYSWGGLKDNIQSRLESAREAGIVIPADVEKQIADILSGPASGLPDLAAIDTKITLPEGYSYSMRTDENGQIEVGKALLLGSSWEAQMNIADKSAINDFSEYAAEKAKETDAKVPAVTAAADDGKRWYGPRRKRCPVGAFVTTGGFLVDGSWWAEVLDDESLVDPGGEHARAAATARRASWDESLHPRGEGGRFGEKADGPEPTDRGVPVASGSTRDEVFQAMGAYDLSTGEQWHPERYEVHPRSGFTVEKHGVPFPRVGGDANLDELELSEGRPVVVDYMRRDGGAFGWERVEGSERPPEYLYRAISEDDWQGIAARGEMKSDARMNLGADEGTVAAFDNPGFYLPGHLYSEQNGEAYDGRLVRIKYDEADGWRYDPIDSYAKTDQAIPFDRIDMVSPIIRWDTATNTESIVRPAALASWDESLHPRGEGGRFGEKPDVDAADSAAKERPDLDVSFNHQSAITIPSAKERAVKWGDANGKVTIEAVTGHLQTMFPNSEVDIVSNALGDAKMRDAATGVLEGWDRMAREHPAVAESVAKVRLDTGFPSGEFVAWNMALRASTWELSAQKAMAADQGFRLDVGKYAYGIAIHEYGHAATAVAVVNERLALRDDDYSTDGVGFDHRPDIFDAFGDGGDRHAGPGRGLGPEPQPVSQYARSDPGELRAEAYALARLADPTDVPADVAEFVAWVDERTGAGQAISVEGDRAVRAAAAASGSIEDQFGPGCVAWAYAVESGRVAAGWDETLHPRGEGGRFGEKPDDGEPPVAVDPTFQPMDYFNAAALGERPVMPTPGPVKGSMPEEVRAQLEQIGGGQAWIDNSGGLPVGQMLAERGAWYDANTAKGGPGEGGMCHWNAAMLHASDPERYTWVTGLAVAYTMPDFDHGHPDQRTGEWIGEARVSWMAHSWIEDSRTGRIIETNVPRNEGHGYAAYFGVALTEPEAKTMAAGMERPMVNADLLDSIAQNHGSGFIVPRGYEMGGPYPNLAPGSPAGRYAQKFDDTVGSWLNS